MMTPEELAKLWQDGLREAYGEGQRWDALSEQQKNISIRVAVKVLERLKNKESIEHYATTLRWTENNGIEHIFKSRNDNEVYTKGNELLADYLLCKIRNYSVEVGS